MCEELMLIFVLGSLVCVMGILLLIGGFCGLLLWRTILAVRICEEFFFFRWTVKRVLLCFVERESQNFLSYVILFSPGFNSF